MVTSKPKEPDLSTPGRAGYLVALLSRHCKAPAWVSDGGELQANLIECSSCSPGTDDGLTGPDQSKQDS